jgi:hypothetical protein
VALAGPVQLFRARCEETSTLHIGLPWYDDEERDATVGRNLLVERVLQLGGRRRRTQDHLRVADDVELEDGERLRERQFVVGGRVRVDRHHQGCVHRRPSRCRLRAPRTLASAWLMYDAGLLGWRAGGLLSVRAMTLGNVSIANSESLFQLRYSLRCSHCPNSAYVLTRPIGEVFI